MRKGQVRYMFRAEKQADRYSVEMAVQIVRCWEIRRVVRLMYTS